MAKATKELTDLLEAEGLDRPELIGRVKALLDAEKPRWGTCPNCKHRGLVLDAPNEKTRFDVLRLLLEYTDGKPAQKVEHKGGINFVIQPAVNRDDPDGNAPAELSASPPAGSIPQVTSED